MSVVKNYYTTDLHNIEEILSILEMRRSLGGRRGLRSAFLRYISDVVNYYTPVLAAQRSGWPANWHENILAKTGRPSQFFGYFVASLLSARLVASRNIEAIQFQRLALPTSVQYAVVTLNYDLVLEGYAAYLEGSFGGPTRGFAKAIGSPFPPESTPLVKLHGSSDSSVIIPPTWNKTVSRGLLPAWNAAFTLLTEATQVRIVGYSLPTADSYVKYLLRAAAIEAPNLKRIDVICLDNRRGEVHSRYDQFVDFPNYRFISARTEAYAETVYKATTRRAQINQPLLDFNQLEAAHEEFFAQPQ